MQRVVFLLAEDEGFEEGGLAEGKAKKCPVDTFLARGRIHERVNASGTDVSTRSFSLQRYSSQRSSVFQLRAKCISYSSAFTFDSKKIFQNMRTDEGQNRGEASKTVLFQCIHSKGIQKGRA